MQIIDLSDSVLNAMAKFAIAIVFCVSCFTFHSFSSIIPTVFASVDDNLFDFCDFNRSANPATLAND